MENLIPGGEAAEIAAVIGTGNQQGVQILIRQQRPGGGQSIFDDGGQHLPAL
jgi:hypothetical protein